LISSSIYRFIIQSLELLKHITSAMSFTRLIRFIPASDTSTILLGQPVDINQDVGLASRKGEDIEARVFNGTSALNPGTLTEKVEKVNRILSPLTQKEVGTIRCIGLNVST